LSFVARADTDLPAEGPETAGRESARAAEFPAGKGREVKRIPERRAAYFFCINGPFITASVEFRRTPDHKS
jgi:hypothetical protein